MRRTVTVITAAAAFAAVIAFLAAMIVGGSGQHRAAPDPAHTIPTTARTLVVSAATAPVSRPGGLLHGRLVEGDMPHAAMMGEVVSDEDCAADVRGISHCRNAVRLADGDMIIVRHPHSMASVPCLTPGERIRVRPA
jgi:hypothetical protein